MKGYTPLYSHTTFHQTDSSFTGIEYVFGLTGISKVRFAACYSYRHAYFELPFSSNHLRGYQSWLPCELYVCYSSYSSYDVLVLSPLIKQSDWGRYLFEIEDSDLERYSRR